MFYRLNNLEIWYGENDINGSYIQIKGIKDSLLNTYECAFINLLMMVFKPMSRGYADVALSELKKVTDMYLSGKMPISVYREMNSGFMYRIKNSKYRSYHMNQEDVKFVDNSYNLMLLGFLKQTLVNMYLGGGWIFTLLIFFNTNLSYIILRCKGHKFVLNTIISIKQHHTSTWILRRKEVIWKRYL